MPYFASWFLDSSSFVCVGCVCVHRKNKGDQKGVVNNLFIYLFSHLFYQVELKFKVGDVIYVYGDMDEDGFYTVSLYFFPLLSYTSCLERVFVLNYHVLFHEWFDEFVFRSLQCHAKNFRN